MDERFQSVDKAQLARRFGAAARHYDAHARFQQEVGQALLEWMPDRPVGTDLTVSGLDLGCGTGFFLPQLANRCHQLVGLDLESLFPRILTRMLRARPAEISGRMQIM